MTRKRMGRLHKKSLRFLGEPQALNDNDWGLVFVLSDMETSVCVSALGIAKSIILSVSNQQNSNNVQANHANQSGQEHHEWNPPSLKESETSLLAYIIQTRERKYNRNCSETSLFSLFLQKKMFRHFKNWQNYTPERQKISEYKEFVPKTRAFSEGNPFCESDFRHRNKKAESEVCRRISCCKAVRGLI